MDLDASDMDPEMIAPLRGVLRHSAALLTQLNKAEVYT